MSLLDMPPELILEIGEKLSPIGSFLLSLTCTTLQTLLKFPQSKRVRSSALREGVPAVIDYLLELGVRFSPQEYSKYLSVEKYKIIKRYLKDQVFSPAERARLAWRIASRSSQKKSIKYALALCSDGREKYVMIGLYCNPETKLLKKFNLDNPKLIKRINPVLVGRFGNLRLLQTCQEHYPFSRVHCQEIASHVIMRSPRYYEMIDYLLEEKYLQLEDCSDLVRISLEKSNLQGLEYCRRKISS